MSEPPHGDGSDVVLVIVAFVLTVGAVWLFLSILNGR